MKCPVASVSVEITSLYQNYQCHGSVKLNNNSTVGNFNCMFSLITLQARCCVYRRDIIDPISYPCNIASRADICLGRLLLVRKLSMLGVRDTEALQSPVCTAVLLQNVLAKSVDKQFQFTYGAFNTTVALACLK